MNRLRGEVPLKLSDGRELMLVLDMEALIEAESAYGKPLPQLMVDMVNGFAGAGRAMLWGAFRARHPDVTLRQAGEMFVTDSDAINASLEQATLASFPEPDEQAGDRQGENPPGKPSGANGAKSTQTRKPSSGKRPGRSS